MALERRSNKFSLFMWVMLTGLLSQNLIIPVLSISVADQKNYYSPDPHAGTPPAGSHGGHHHGTPSHGGGGGGGYSPTPSTPTPTPTPSTPNCGTPPSHGSTPSTPSGGGGSYHSPPTSGGVSPPSGGGGSVSPPLVPTPTTPTPTSPSTPSPPLFPDPNTFPGTCNFWSGHPGLIWGVLGWWGTVGSAFGVPSLPGFGAGMSLQQALTNTHANGLGALYREGTASFLNSMVDRKFPFTPQQVRDSFLAALHSDKAAGAQAQVFKLANEGHLKPRN